MSSKRNGFTRNKILKTAKMKSGKRITKILADLECSGFIRVYSQPKIKREQIFQLVDAFTLFHFHFLENNNTKDPKFWTNIVNTSIHNAWAGLSFEIVGLLHTDGIKKKLQVLGVQSSEYAWRSRKTDEDGQTKGVQIDLLIDRADNIINLCEIKYSNLPYEITKDYDLKLRIKIEVFRQETLPRKAIHLLMLTTFGVVQNKYYGIIQNEITIDDLFTETE